MVSSILLLRLYFCNHCVIILLLTTLFMNETVKYIRERLPHKIIVRSDAFARARATQCDIIEEDVHNKLIDIISKILDDAEKNMPT